MALNEEFKSIVPQIEQIGQIPKGKYFTDQDILDIENEFFEQDKQLPKVSSLIKHIEGLEYVKFDEVDDDLPQDVSVDMQRFGVTRVPAKLQLAKVNASDEEPPI